MIVVQAIEDLRRLRREQSAESCGLVPTMGYLHEGHLSLVRRARAENGSVGVSIFVNPAQFNDPGDLTAYPRDLERDLALLQEEGVDLVWTPSDEIAYPSGFQTSVEVAGITRVLEGTTRPGHFAGVTTVVAKIFNVFQPQRAYFGQKDAQQVAVIKRMTVDLNFDVDIVVCPTVREVDGLAMSSRNSRLSDEARFQAACLSRALNAAADAIHQGERNAADIKILMHEIIEREPLSKVDYISIADPLTLEEIDDVNDGTLLSLAVFIDGIRLIDNHVVDTNLIPQPPD